MHTHIHAYTHIYMYAPTSSDAILSFTIIYQTSIANHQQPHLVNNPSHLSPFLVSQEGNEKTAALVREEGAEAYPHVCDVRLREDVRRAARAAREDLQDDVHVLVNNAGVMTGRELLELSEQEVTNTMTTNTVAHFWVGQVHL